jgi:hypothetical protein
MIIISTIDENILNDLKEGPLKDFSSKEIITIDTGPFETTYDENLCIEKAQNRMEICRSHGSLNDTYISIENLQRIPTVKMHGVQLLGNIRTSNSPWYYVLVKNRNSVLSFTVSNLKELII